MSEAGAYEWWYFDFVDQETGLAAVLIIYQGNPFSRRYIQKIESGAVENKSQFPAYSLSIYEQGITRFFHFREFLPAAAHFSEHEIHLGDALHMYSDGDGVWNIKLRDRRADGALVDLHWQVSRVLRLDSLQNTAGEQTQAHVWNLVAPAAQFKGEILMEEKGRFKDHWSVNTPGYHDHNHGNEPMKDSFRDWIWGRFHLEDMTLIYYGFCYSDSWNMNSWLISNGDAQVQHSPEMQYSRIQLPNVFGLLFPRVQKIEIGEYRFLINHNDILDSGPFYVRSFPELKVTGSGTHKSVRGIGEYIKPSRIYQKLFWPLVDMRIRYDAEPVHWVQKNPLLFPITW